MSSQITTTTPEESASTPDIEPDETTAKDAAPDDPDVSELSLDLVFEVLKNERRRHVLRYLEENPGGTTLSDLAEHIAAIENDKPITALSSQERKRVYVGLYQCHLPKMDDTDVIQFDDNRGTVEIGPNAEQLYTFLDAEATEKSTWPYYYIGATIFGAVLFGASVTTAVIGLSVAFAVTIGSIGLLAIGQHVSTP
ncbi:MAG: DUF7344 domain-containing protein [Halobacteriota archaeon]